MEKNFTSRTNPSYAPAISLQDDSGVFSGMRVKVRSQQRCPICRSTFRLTSQGLTCPRDPHVKPSTYYIEWHFQGTQYKLYNFDSFRSAYRKAAVIEEEIQTGKFRPQCYRGHTTTVNKKFEFIERFNGWQELKEKTLKPSSYRKLAQYKKEYDSFFGSEDIRTIGTDRITAYYESLIGTVSNKTVANKLGVLHAFFKSLYDREAIAYMPKFPKIRYSRKEPVWISKEQQQHILSAMPLEHRPIFAFLFESGCRHGEARALQWTDIDFDKAVITIRHNFSGTVLTTPKDGESRKIPLTNALRELLLSQPRTLRSQFVFTLNGKPYYESSIGKIWRAACKQVGIVGVRAYDGTRHSFASQLVNKGKSLEIIGEILGHSDIRTTKKYAHVHLDAMRNAMEE